MKLRLVDLIFMNPCQEAILAYKYYAIKHGEIERAEAIRLLIGRKSPYQHYDWAVWLLAKMLNIHSLIQWATYMLILTIPLYHIRLRLQRFNTKGDRQGMVAYCNKQALKHCLWGLYKTADAIAGLSVTFDQSRPKLHRDLRACVESTAEIALSLIDRYEERLIRKMLKYGLKLLEKQDQAGESKRYGAI